MVSGDIGFFHARRDGYYPWIVLGGFVRFLFDVW